MCDKNKLIKVLQGNVTEFSLSDLEPFQPEPLVEEYRELWDLLEELVFAPDADGNTRFMP